MIPLGHVAELVRYPVKSMAGTAPGTVFLGWYGVEGDRRFAFRRVGDESGFPWLSASQFPELLLYEPMGQEGSGGEPLPTHVRTPAGSRVELRSAELRREIEARSGIRVELVQVRQGTFDDAPVSVIGMGTISAICRAAGVEVDTRRFRANVVLDTSDPEPFLEDSWVGGTLVFGEGEPVAAVRVTKRDVRCMMINLDPDTARQDAEVLRTVVRQNENNAGVYGMVLRPGPIHVGQAVSLLRDAP